LSVLVIGNAVIDRCYLIDRLPTPGETLLARDACRQFGGKGLIQAVVAARAGAQVRLVAGVGDDPEADEIAAYLEHEPVGALLVRSPGRSDESVIMVGRGGENMIVSTAHQARALAPQVAGEAIDAVETGGILLLQGNLSALTTRQALIRACARGLRRIANAAPVAFGWDELQADIDVLIVNEVEARLVAPLRSASVIVTAGAAGATLIQGQQRWHVPAPPVPTALDTTGAGDVLCGTLAAALERQMPLLEALACAVRAAAVKVARQGTSAGLPSSTELREILG
jgi:ribokinase